MGEGWGEGGNPPTLSLRAKRGNLVTFKAANFCRAGNMHSIQAAADVLATSQHAIALTGAGLSVESGIPSFRGPDGLWTRYGQPSNLSYGEFAGDPRGWWERRLRDEVTPGNPTYDLKDAVDHAEPNAGHLALADLEARGVLKGVITQNVDDLHRRAGSRALLEIHGNRNFLRCVGCGRRWPRGEVLISDLPPVCTGCGGVIKLDTVMFGESIPRTILDACFAEVQRCDAMLLVGTSGTVNPAAQFPALARELGARIIEVNPGPTQLTHLAHLAITGPAGEMLPQIAASVLARLEGAA